MPGRHVTDRQKRLFMTLKKTHTIDVAAAKAGFSRATGYRLAEDPSLLSGKAAPRGRRRPDPLADIFETEVVPILENSPGIRSVGVFEALMQRKRLACPILLRNPVFGLTVRHGNEPWRIDRDDGFWIDRGRRRWG